MNSAAMQVCGAILAAFVTACSGCGSSPPPQPMPAPMPPPTAVAPPVPALPPPCDQAQFLATSTSMQARAAVEAPGMKPEGTPICGVVAPGQAVVGPGLGIQVHLVAALDQGPAEVGDIRLRAPPGRVDTLVVEGEVHGFRPHEMPAQGGWSTEKRRSATGSSPSCYRVRLTRHWSHSRT